MKPVTLGLTLVALLALAACDSADPRPPYDLDALSFDAALLVGTWDLAWVGNPWAGPEQPASGPRRTYVLREDGTFSHLIEGAVEREGTFAVETVCNEVTNTCRPELNLDYVGRYWRGVSTEWLVFDARYIDGPLYAFRRR